MGRHAADWPAPDPSAPDSRIKIAGQRLPNHADLFAPTPGSAADKAREKRAGAAFEKLVQPHRAALQAYVMRLTDGDAVVADSVVKETLYRASQDPSRYPQRGSAVRPWLVLTARNVLRDGERHAPAGHDDRPELIRPGSERSVPRAAPASKDPIRPERERSTVAAAPATTIVAAMQDLSTLHRELLVELFYGGTSLEEAAANRGVPVETVKSGLYFAMRALRAVLDQQITERHGSR